MSDLLKAPYATAIAKIKAAVPNAVQMICPPKAAANPGKTLPNMTPSKTE